MSEKLLNVREVSQYLGISAEDLRRLVDSGKVPAYRLGGAILRFRKDQIEQIKAQGIPKLAKSQEEPAAGGRYTGMERLKDFLYFNDFYIICAIIIVVLLVFIFLC